MKYYKTICCDEELLKLFGSLWGFQPVDRRKKYFICIHCKKEHETKRYVIIENKTALHEEK